jgi:hypothetical protein
MLPDLYMPRAARLTDGVARTLGKPRPNLPVNDYSPSEAEREALRHFSDGFDLALGLGFGPNDALLFARGFTARKLHDAHA